MDTYTQYTGCKIYNESYPEKLKHKKSQHKSLGKQIKWKIVELALCDVSLRLYDDGYIVCNFEWKRLYGWSLIYPTHNHLIYHSYWAMLCRILCSASMRCQTNKNITQWIYFFFEFLFVIFQKKYNQDVKSLLQFAAISVQRIFVNYFLFSKKEKK